MNALTKYDEMRAALIHVHRIDELKDIRDKAEAIRRYLKQSGETLDNQNMMAEIRLRSDRRSGELLEEMEKNEGGRPTETSDIVSPVSPPTLAELGITRKQSSRLQAIASIPEEVFDQHVEETKAKGKELTTSSLVKAAKQQEKQHRAEAALSNVSPWGDRYTVLHGDFRTADVDDESADWIITDPPYPAEYLPLYSDLSHFAARVLKPGGSLLVMSGQSYLPEIMCRLGEQMAYHWTLAYLTPGGQAPHLFQRNVNTFWKPLLWFIKGKYAGHCIGDVCKSKTNDNDKRHHHWGQSESGMADIIERFTLPGQTIIDPFLGGGTTGIVAVQLNRFFVGIDKDENAINTTMVRLGEIANADV